MDIERALAQKLRRRMAEYVGIIAFQSFFAFSFAQLADAFLLLIFGVSAFGLAWTLAIQREKRRTLAPENKKRIIADAAESFILMFVLAMSAIIAIQLRLSLVNYESYVCIALLAYFIGSLAGEVRWTKTGLPLLKPEQRKNYAVNLNGSIIFPFNFGIIRRSLRQKNK
jgi:hypothetical protein